MHRTDRSQIVHLDDHEDLADLQSYDFPANDIINADTILTAKAWIGSDLACFFTKPECTERFVVLFRAYQGFMPALGGDDMREAEIGGLYALTVFVSERHLPIVDRVERVDARLRKP